jgi:uncharacterized protein YabE (DUF348 family)
MSRNLLARLGALLLALLLLLVYLQTRVTVTVWADGASRQVRTHAPTVGALLHEAGLTVHPQDLVLPPLETRLTPGLRVTLKRADTVQADAGGQTQVAPTQPGAPLAVTARRGLTVTVTVSEDGGPMVQFQTAALTVGEALWEGGYRLYRADQVTPALDAPVTPGLTVSISRSHPVTVQADGQTLHTRTHSATVGEVLAEVGVALVGQDYAVPGIDEPLAEAVRVVRVKETLLTESQALPFPSAYQAMAEWEIDTVGQVQAGLAGVQQRHTRVRYEDGVEVTRTVEAEYAAVKPTPRIIGYGTKIVIRTVDTPDGPIEYWRAYTMYATSYAAKFMGGSNRTAAGLLLTKGIVAIDRRYIPFFTRMYVPGYGLAVAGDTGGGVKGRWIDLGFDDFNYEGWHQQVMVYFLTPVPPADQITWIIPSTVP